MFVIVERDLTSYSELVSCCEHANSATRSTITFPPKYGGGTTSMASNVPHAFSRAALRPEVGVSRSRAYEKRERKALATGISGSKRRSRASP